MTIKRLNELYKGYSQFPSIGLVFPETCGYCGRQNRVRVFRGQSYFVECPKWSSFWTWLRGKSDMHYMAATGIPVYDKKGDFLE